MSGAHLKKQKVLFAPPQGFSIIELIVTMSMFVMISMALLFNYNTFSGHITLDTLSNQIALWIRDAQVEAMSVKVGAASGAYSGYGIHFDRATPDQFIFFADLNGNADYDAGGTCGDATSECVKVITLLKGNKISKLCGDITAVSAPSSDCPLDTSSYFDISFKRPNLDAKIKGDPGTGKTLYARADVTLTSQRGYERTIETWITGLISVQ